MSLLPWALSYRPRNVKDFIFQDKTHKALVKKFIAEKNIPCLLLSGHHGTGKTSLAYVLKHELEIEDMDFLEINASDENSVDTIRTKVKGFISTFAASAFKIVFLDEADLLSPSAQGALRNMMESYAENARFILTCNHPHKIIPALKSRCQELEFASLDRQAMNIKAIKILEAEGIELTDEDFDTVESYVDSSYPDFRKLLNNLQQNCIDGKLVSAPTFSKNDEFNFQLMEMIGNGQWSKIRAFVSSNVPDDQWESVYRFMYGTIGEVEPFASNSAKMDEAICIIADSLYKHNFVADPEINFAACIIKLSRTAK